MPTRPHGLEVETRLPPVSLYLLSMALTPKICSIFCLPPLQTGRVTGHSLGEHEKWCRVPPPPHTSERHQCTVFLEGLPSHCPAPQGSSKAPESLQSATLSSVHAGPNHSFRPAGP